MSDLRVDHVIYAVDNLDAAGRRFYDEFGLASVDGGRHPGWGTANRIVPLGNAYLELIAVVDPEEAGSSDLGLAVTNATATGDRLVGWAVATNDLEAVAQRLGLDVVGGSRTRPDGTTLSWRLVGIERALETGALPLFIEWDCPPELHPGRTSVAHRVKPAGITSVEVTAEEESLRRWLGDFDFELRITNGTPKLSAIAIGADEGELLLRS
jgi:hypothetical protein